MFTIGITGHRSLKNPEDVRDKIAYTLAYFKKREGEVKVLSAIAVGTDTIFAEEALKQKIPLQIILPFDKKDYLKDFTKQQQKVFTKLINNNKWTVLTALQSDNKDERNEAYKKTGEHIVDACNAMLAVYDGNKERGKGGTAQIVKYAEEKKKELHIIKALREGEIDKNNSLEQLYNKYDTKAKKIKIYHFYLLWWIGIALGLLAASCFALAFINKQIQQSNNLKFIVGVAEFLFLLLSAFFIGVLSKKGKNKFLENRRNAEYARSILWFSEAGIPIKPIIHKDFMPNMQVLEEEKKHMMEIDSIKNFHHAQRVAWSLAVSQANYHKLSRIPRLEKYLERTKETMEAITALFLFAATMKFFYELVEYLHVNCILIFLNLLHPYQMFFSFLLPPVYAALEGVKHFGEWKKNINKSKAMYNLLIDSSERIIKCPVEISLEDEATILRSILESENTEWAFEIKSTVLEIKP